MLWQGGEQGHKSLNKDERKDIELRRKWLEIFLQCLVHTRTFRSGIVQNFLLPRRVSVYKLQGRNGRGNSTLGLNTGEEDDSVVWDDEVCETLSSSLSSLSSLSSGMLLLLYFCYW